ncbi:glia maturation factor gamma-like [Dysidea avara]|uniref:glia maturation factor gamma-like n=1 Tax=Dysidea avara TaxID=196820 RepID=UPI00331D5200
MAGNLQICTVDPGLKEKLKKFRFRKDKTNGAIVMKINSTTMTVVEDEVDEDVLDNVSLDDLQAELPEHQPRFVAYSYCHKHDDGRISYPLCFIFISPQGCKPELQMMYAGTKTSLVKEGQFTKVFELRAVDEMTEEWLLSKLGFFR